MELPDEAVEAEQERDTLEQQLLPIFTAGLAVSQAETEYDLPQIDVNIIRRLLGGVISWYRRSVYRTTDQSVGEPGLNNEVESIDDLVDKLLPQIISRYKELRKWAMSQPGFGGPELTVQHLAARALSTGTFNLVGQEVAKEQGTMKKVWVTRADDKVRPLHRRLHGRSRPMGGVFYRWPTGQILRFPGDPQAPPQATIGCRCVLVMSTDSAEDIKNAFPPLPEPAP